MATANHSKAPRAELQHVIDEVIARAVKRYGRELEGVLEEAQQEAERSRQVEVGDQQRELPFASR